MAYSTRRQIRLIGHDYSQNGIYFVTICTKDKELIFGHLSNYKMLLNKFGKIARNEWVKNARLREYVYLDKFVIMPDHIHGILIIKNENVLNRDLFCRVMARHDPTPYHNDIPGHKFGKPLAQSLSSVIGAYKSSVTREINRIRKLPGHTIWQRGFYDHIIRNKKELFAMRRYISNNPANHKF